MKKLFLILLACAMALSFCACSSNEATSTPDIETQYYNYVQQCIADGKTEEAITVLEEGIANTGSEKLKNLLDELNGNTSNSATPNDETTTTDGTTVPAQNSDVATDTPTGTKTTTVASDDFSKYVGKWYCPGYREGNIGWDLQLEIQTKDDRMAIILKFVDNNYSYDYEENLCAELKQVVSLSDIKDNTLLLSYEDDGYRNSGTMELVFLKDRIVCVSELKEPIDDYSVWGFYFGSEILVKEETAEDMFD